jgi:hypothetical protein
LNVLLILKNNASLDLVFNLRVKNLLKLVNHLSDGVPSKHCDFMQNVLG